MIIKYNNNLLFVHSNIPYDEDYINVDLYPTDDIYNNIPLLFCRFYTKLDIYDKFKMTNKYNLKIPYYYLNNNENIESGIFLSSKSLKIVIFDKKRFREFKLDNNKFINYFKNIGNKWRIFVNNIIEMQPTSLL